MRTSSWKRRPQHSAYAFGALLTSVVLSGVLVGCGPSQETPATNTASAGGDFKVALVLPGLRSDNGWNAVAYRGLQAVQKELNLKDEDVAVVDNQSSAGDQEKNLRAFASKKYNVVIGNGHEFDDIANKIEGEFPKT